ncbi:MAG: fumarylacetoacetate hydrolase family protein [Proteobacteria bacterium]|nr:fumarylacetoacetate hydrolase family protein [Pseudomonadota bacterium]
MKIARVLHENIEKYGIVEEDFFYTIKNNPFITKDFQKTGEVFDLKNLKILPPCEPSKIVAVGLNYKSHAEEMKKDLPEEPIIFLKPSTAVIGQNDYIILPKDFKRVDYECELGVVIGRRAKNVSIEDARNYILGYTCFNDVTERYNQKKDGQWTRAKGYDTFAPIGPWIETECDPASLNIYTILNDRVVQSGNTCDLIFSVDKLISFISGVMTLLPGDVIATGTPAGIGALQDGDKVEIKIDGIGTLTNFVKKS